MRTKRWRGSLVAMSLFSTVFVAGMGAEAGPESARAITGFTARQTCGLWPVSFYCPEDEIFQVHAVEGVGGTAMYRPQDALPVHLKVTCMSFSDYGDSQERFSPLGPVFRGSGVSEDGQTYYFVAVDLEFFWGYDRYHVSPQKDSGPCGTGNSYLWHTESGDFRILSPGDAL